jgi:hypothetical protein
MEMKKLATAMAMTTLVTLGLLLLSLAGKPGATPMAIAQRSPSVTCYPLSCYGQRALLSYKEQCEQAKRSYEENRRTCEKILNTSQQAMNGCIHSLDWTVNQPCTCADSCRQATCTKWRVGDNACVSAEFR